MSIESEIGTFFKTKTDISTPQKIEFLIKLWNSKKLKSCNKFDAILKYFSTNLMSDLDEIEFLDIHKFLNLTYPTGTVSLKIKKELITSAIKQVDKNPSSQSIRVALEIANVAGLQDYFKSNLKILIKLFKSVLQNLNSIQDDLEEIKVKVIDRMFLMCKVEGYDKMFLEELLIPLYSVFANETTHYELIKNVFFHSIESQTADIKIFNTEMSSDKKILLIESFIGIFKTKHDEIVKLLQHLNETDYKELKDFEFLHKIGQVYELMMKNEIEFPLMKKQNQEFFTDLSSKIQENLETSRESMKLEELLEILCIFIKSDPFLLETNLYPIIVNVMLKEKSNEEMKSFEELMKNVLKIYGKDLGQFLIHFLKNLGIEMENSNLPKQKKRKLKETSGVASKKRKTSNSSLIEANDESSQSFWTELILTEFSEIVEGLNVAQITKILKVLNKFLTNDLGILEKSQLINENNLYKIIVVCTMLCKIFDHTRIMEQLMGKTIEIVTTVKHFNVTLNLFSKVILKIEYDSRLVMNYLNLLRSYNGFLMLFYYNFDKNIDHDFDTIFKENQLTTNNEWEIIQQRVRNFGKIDELNHLNLLIIQQKEKSEIYKEFNEKFNLNSILSKEDQIEFMMTRPDYRSFFVKSLKNEQINIFVEFLMRNSNDKVEEITLQIIQNDQKLLEEIILAIVKFPETNQKLFKFLSKLPIYCSSDDCKKLILEKISNSKLKSTLLSEILRNIFKNDGYKALFRDFKMKNLVDLLNLEEDDINLELILINTAKRINASTLENFNWIVENGSEKVNLCLSKVVSDINLTPGAGANAEQIKTFKLNLSEKVLNITNNFMFSAKLVTENFSSMNEKQRNLYAKELQNFIEQTNSKDKDKNKILLSILKNTKKLNLNDEIKVKINQILFDHLKHILIEELPQEIDMNYVNDIIGTLKPFKNSLHHECLEHLKNSCNLDEPMNMILYIKLHQISIESRSEDKKANTILARYLNLVEEIITKNFTMIEDKDKLSLTTQIIETNNSILKNKNISLSIPQIDKFLNFAFSTKTTTTNDIEQYSSLLNAIGETLFLITVMRHNYFKIRTSHFFNLYGKFVENIYFYKNDSNEDFTPIESSLLLMLSLKAENIMTAIMKNHEIVLKNINGYIASMFANIFVQNPRTLSVGDKLKVNIKNICRQLFNSFDEKTRKHVFRATNETTQEVYTDLFNNQMFK